MTTTWTIAIDWDRNNDFTGTYDDVTNRVMSAKWFLGMRAAYQETADDGMLKVQLRNDDRNFSPEYTGSPLYGKLVPFRPVMVQAYDGVTTRTMWRGWIESIRPSVGQYGERTVEIVAAGPMQFLKAADTNIPLQENQRADQIIAVLLKQVVIPPALSAAWIVGVSRVGIDTFLANTSVYSNLEQGITTFTMVGDNWVRQGGSTEDRDTFNVYQAITDVVAAERGRFFFDREGKAVFWNRHHLLKSMPTAATFDNSMQDMQYVYGAPDELKNEVVIVCHPRTLSATSNEILWELEGTVNIPINSSRTVTARYRDDSGNRIGGKNVTVDGVIFSQGTGTVTISPKANSAELIITNTSADLAVLTGCLIKGQKITDFGRLEAKASDGLSIAHYGRRVWRKSLPALDNFNNAQSVATFELARRKDPRGSIRKINLKSHGTQAGGHHEQQLTLSMGSKISIQEAQTAHDRSYIIIGEAHRLLQAGALWETTWYLEPANPVGYWVVGESQLGVNTVLAY